MKSVSTGRYAHIKRLLLLGIDETISAHLAQIKTIKTRQ